MTDQQDLNFNIAISSNKRNEAINPQSQAKIQNQPKAEEEPNKETGNDGITDLIKKSANPGVCIFTIAFKIGALVSYILLDVLSGSEALTYLIVILLGSADFWTTKNISGRVLVGLRWWNEVKEDGTEVWIFESKNEKKENSADRRIFWGSLYINLIAWIIIFVWDLIRLKFVWVFIKYFNKLNSKGIIALIMLVFAGTNFYGYFKCSKEQQQNLMKFGAKAVVSLGKKGAEQVQKANSNNQV